MAERIPLITGAADISEIRSVLNSLVNAANRAYAPISSGTFTITEDTPLEVTDIAVTANCIIDFTLKTVGGTPGPIIISDITAGENFEVTGTAGDTSVYNYTIMPGNT